MSDASQVRINELARELEVKAKAIIDLLPGFGVTEKKTHSSSIPVEVAEKVRQAIRGTADAEAAEAAAKEAAARPAAKKPVAPARGPAPGGAPPPPQATLRPPTLLQLHRQFRRRRRPSLRPPPQRLLRLPLRLRLWSSPLHPAAPPRLLWPRPRSLLRQHHRLRRRRLLNPRRQYRVRDRARLPGNLLPPDLRREHHPRSVRLRLGHSRMPLALQPEQQRLH